MDGFNLSKSRQSSEVATYEAFRYKVRLMSPKGTKYRNVSLRLSRDAVRETRLDANL